MTLLAIKKAGRFAFLTISSSFQRPKELSDPLIFLEIHLKEGQAGGLMSAPTRSKASTPKIILFFRRYSCSQQPTAIHLHQHQTRIGHQEMRIDYMQNHLSIPISQNPSYSSNEGLSTLVDANITFQPSLHRWLPLRLFLCVDDCLVSTQGSADNWA